MNADRARAVVSDPDPVDLLLVCSSGGHLLQLVAVRDAWCDRTRAWVTNDRADARSLLVTERVFYAYGPTTRNVKNLLRNTHFAWSVLRRTKPRAILTTGAALAVPFAWFARFKGIEVVYVETLSRIEKPSLSCRLVRPVASRVYVQWPELVNRVPGARYVGSVVGP